MSTASKVSAVSSSKASSATSRAAGGSRVGSFDRVDGVWGAAPADVSGHWRPNYDDSASYYRIFDGEASDQDDEQSQFTPLVARMAASFPACISYSETAPLLFITDLLRGVRIYEFNMRLFAGSFASSGSVFNRVS